MILDNVEQLVGKLLNTLLYIVHNILIIIAAVFKSVAVYIFLGTSWTIR